MLRKIIRSLAFCLVCCAVTTLAPAQDSIAAKKEESKDSAQETKKQKPVKMVELALAGGKVQLKKPETWKAPDKLRSRIIEREFAVPAVEGDKENGRLTMMRSGWLSRTKCTALVWSIRTTRRQENGGGCEGDQERD